MGPKFHTMHFGAVAGVEAWPAFGWTEGAWLKIGEVSFVEAKVPTSKTQSRAPDHSVDVKFTPITQPAGATSARVRLAV